MERSGLHVLSSCFLRKYALVILILRISSATSLHPALDSTSKVDLFDWARQHGAYISESIEIRSTDYGGRGLFATKDIPAKEELIRIPYDLQLGVRQLAEGADEEMQSMARNLPWQYILDNELFFIPLSIALCAEKRKGVDSIFEPFLRDLPTLPTHSLVATGKGANDSDLGFLLAWAPILGKKVLDRRNGIQTIYQQLAPPSLSLQELVSAATNVCSRSLVRKRKPELSTDQIQRVGEFAASDHSRMLPVIDLVNHGSLQAANVWVGHLSSNSDAAATEDDDASNDYSTSLKSTRNIKAGDELLFDYSGDNDEKISNDRLLLDYGFVLPKHTERVTLSLDEFVPALMALDDKRQGMNNLPKQDLDGLDGLIQFLLKQASVAQAGAALAFDSEGEPTVQTLAIALAMTCQGQEDVTRAFQPVLNNPTDGSLLPAQVVESCTEAQKEFARGALKYAAILACTKRPLVDGDASCVGEGEEATFANVAREYSAMCHAMLHRVVDPRL